tara:strand:- start:61 stop:699 length:639 start_codon:yes stop_codon:yes gene_type:complete
MKIVFAILAFSPLYTFSQEVDASDILFLKIQELEGELSSLRSELESQAYLIEKLLNEESNQLENRVSVESQTDSAISTFRFEGINDSKSIEEVYDQARDELFERKDSQAAKESFSFLVNNFIDDEKTPLSLFWLGEILLLESNLEESEKFFQRLVSDFPDHFRTPLAHKKIGDILTMSDDPGAAKIKYQFVVQTFPESSASSLALQLLENME